jgi:hypothetical protein
VAFIKRSFLLEKSKLVKSSYIKETKAEAKLTVFLSHSHKDRKLAEGFQNILGEQGISVYIDWQDSALPDSPNKETAERLKQKIKELDLFILLATDNSLSSRWCPWEIGVADSSKEYDSILIVPIVEDSGEFKGSEYLQLYKRIEITQDDKLIILEPSFKEYGRYSTSHYGESFKSFLEKNTIKTIKKVIRDLMKGMSFQ